MRLLMAIALALILVMYGCIGGNGGGDISSVDEGVNYSVDYSGPSTEGDVNITPPSGGSYYNSSQFSSYHHNPTASVSIFMFDVGDPLFWDGRHPVDGRLILIKKGDFDVLIYSLPNGTFSEGIADVKSRSDDIEVLIIPSCEYSSLSTLVEGIKSLNVGAIIAPPCFAKTNEYNEITSMGIPVYERRAGDVDNFNGMTFTYFGPYDDLPEDLNSLIIGVNDSNLSVLFYLDSVGGLLTKAINDYRDALHSFSIVEMPNYGRNLDVNTLGLLFSDARSNVFIFDGSSLVVGSPPLGDRDASMHFVKEVLSKESYSVWESPIVVSYDRKNVSIRVIE